MKVVVARQKCRAPENIDWNPVELLSPFHRTVPAEFNCTPIEVVLISAQQGYVVLRTTLT